MREGQQRGSTRREVLAGAGFLSLLAVRPALATPETMDAAIRSFTGGKEMKDGRVALDIPPLVENGNSVPLGVSVESPMTPQDHVKTIAVFNERNPQPDVVRFHLTPKAGRAAVSTRIRLGDSQTIVAVAQMSDGTFWRASANLIVTLPACVES
jgi:sulfur-oxidizing protein SoxY